MKKFLVSERLYLREISEDDLHLLFELHRDAEVMEYIRPPETTIEETAVTFKRIQSTNKYKEGLGLWMCHENSSDLFIGWFILKNLDDTDDIEIGYRLHKKFWGKGFATEMSKVLLKKGFENPKLEKIVGATHPANKASQHVLEKIGMKFARIQHVYRTDAWIYECFNPRGMSYPFF